MPNIFGVGTAIPVLLRSLGLILRQLRRCVIPTKAGAH